MGNHSGWLYDEYQMPDGSRRRVAKSISFASMDDSQFNGVYKSSAECALELILRRKFHSPAGAEKRRQSAAELCGVMGMQCLLAKVMERGIFRVPAPTSARSKVKPSISPPFTIRLTGRCPLAASCCQKENCMSLYRSINGAIWRNIWVVGDLHGCHTLLMNELERVRFDPLCDLLISVGDLIDRQGGKRRMPWLITMPRFMAVRGNHEQMMLDGLRSSGKWITGSLTVADGSLTLTTTKHARLSRWSIWLQVCHSSSR